MRNTFITLIAPDLDESAAQRAARESEKYLISNGYVSDSMTNCVLDSALGYPPGPRFSELFTEPPCSFGLTFNGVEVRATTIPGFHENGQDGFDVFCPSCGARADMASWGRALDGPYFDVTRTLVCPACKREERLDRYIYRPYVGFARFWITLWNTPPLREDRLHELSDAAAASLRIVLGTR